MRPVLAGSGALLAALFSVTPARAVDQEAHSIPESEIPAPAAPIPPGLTEPISEVTVSAPEPRYVAPTTRDSIGRVWAPVLINGRGPFRLVLDTGASKSAVLRRVADALGIPLRPSNMRVHGVTGSALVPSIYIDQLEVGDLLMESATLPVVPDVFGGADGVMGGIRGLMHYMQRTAIQGSPQTLAHVTGRWIRGAKQKAPGVHPFRKAFHELQIGDTLNSAEREVTLEDIERFAALSGDTFYAHMDEEAARRNPLFGGRVAHGYFLISAAAGLFVDPPYGPVLANYGIDRLRFVKPVKPGDRIKVRLTCKTKSLRAEKGYGEVAWDTEITNQNGEVVASYDVLTMVSEQPVS